MPRSRDRYTQFPHPKSGFALSCRVRFLRSGEKVAQQKLSRNYVAVRFSVIYFDGRFRAIVVGPGARTGSSKTIFTESVASEWHGCGFILDHRRFPVADDRVFYLLTADTRTETNRRYEIGRTLNIGGAWSEKKLMAELSRSAVLLSSCRHESNLSNGARSLLFSSFVVHPTRISTPPLAPSTLRS